MGVAWPSSPTADACGTGRARKAHGVYLSKAHLWPITGIPETIARGMAGFRDLFCRMEGFEHVSRYVTGLVLSPNKTLQGIYALQVWDRDPPSRRAMHEAVFEAGWDSHAFITRHRVQVARDHQGRGREVISLDWTLAHHERGPEIYAVTKGYDYVERRTSLFQTVVTAVVSNHDWIDGLEIVAQDPKDLEAEAASAKRQPKRATSRWRRCSGGCWSYCTTTNIDWSTANGQR